MYSMLWIYFLLWKVILNAFLILKSRVKLIVCRAIPININSPLASRVKNVCWDGWKNNNKTSLLFLKCLFIVTVIKRGEDSHVDDGPGIQTRLKMILYGTKLPLPFLLSSWLLLYLFTNDNEDAKKLSGCCFPFLPFLLTQSYIY